MVQANIEKRDAPVERLLEKKEMFTEDGWCQMRVWRSIAMLSLVAALLPGLNMARAGDFTEPAVFASSQRAPRSSNDCEAAAGAEHYLLPARWQRSH